MRSLRILVSSIIALLLVQWYPFLAAQQVARPVVSQALDEFEHGQTVQVVYDTAGKTAIAAEEVVPQAEIPVPEVVAVSQPEPVVSEAVQVPPTESREQSTDASAAEALIESSQGATPSLVLDALELKGMDILDILKLISMKSGLNIVAGSNIHGKVTIYLKDVNVWDALRIILETNDLAYEKIGNIIKVIPAKEYELIYGRKFNDKTQVKVVPLRYATAPEIIPLLTQMKSVIGKAFSDDKSNTIVLIDTALKLEEMQSFIKKADAPLATQTFPLNYSKVADLEEKVTKMLTKNVGSVSIDARTNKMVVRDTPSKIKEISSVLSAFDERHREVLIEAKIVQVILSDQFKMGVDWQYLTTSVHNLNLQGNFDILSASDKFGKVGIGALDPDEYTAFLEVLKTLGTTNTLSNPHITTLNNEEAKILVGSNEPYVTTQTITTASGPTTTSETVNFIEVGVKLYVTPTIAKDDFVTMKIRPEISSVTSYLTTSQNNKIPIVETSQAETAVMVKDGATIVIAGLIKDENVKTLKKIPLLGDIPILGAAFQNQDDLKRKTETVVFLTPHIISGEADSYKITEMPRFFGNKGY